MSFGARATVRLGALEHNFDQLRGRLPDARVMVVVKANAYGHGLVESVRTLRKADSFAVARLVEGQRIRDAGFDDPVVLLSGVLTASELDEAAASGFEIVVHCPLQLSLLAAHTGPAVVAWLKFDTGMTRLGFPPEAAEELIETLGSLPSVDELRLMTHLANADDTGNAFTDEQMDRFREVTRGFDGDVSFANSPGMLGWEYCDDARAALGFKGDLWIRPGIALYGISPFANATGRDLGLKPVMQFEARVLAVKPMSAGAKVGYTSAWTAPRDSTVGIISAGYGDGYSRHFRNGTPVLLNGRRVPLIGKVSMDMLAVDLGPDASDRPGDVATLWGDELPVEEIAPYADAIPYELVGGVTHREAALAVDD